MGESDVKREDDEELDPLESGAGVISDALVVSMERHMFVQRFSQLLRNSEAGGKPHPHYKPSASYDSETDEVVLEHREEGNTRIVYERFRRGFAKSVALLAIEEIDKIKEFMARYDI